MLIEHQPRAHGRDFPIDDVMAIHPSVFGAGAPIVDRWSGVPVAGGRFWNFLMGDGPEASFARSGAVAVIRIAGPLMKQASYFDGYDSIRKRFAAALTDPNTRAVLLLFDSPSGTSARLLNAVRTMNAAKAAAKKPVFAFADDVAWSAAYLLASVADRILLGETGSVGSIGCMAMLLDRTAANQAAGLRVELIASGKQKTESNPDAPITDDAIKRVQALVDDIAGRLATIVSESRTISPGKILAMEAATFMGDAAVRAGLADGVSTLEQVLRTAEAEGQAAKPNTTTTSSGSSGGAKGETKMKSVLLALGLLETASEAEAVTAVTALKDQHRQSADKAKAHADRLGALETLIGKTGEEAAGTVRGLLATAEAHAKLVAQHTELAAAVAQKEREALVAQGVASGQLTPALVEKWAEQASIDSLKAFLAIAPRAIPAAPLREAAPPGVNLPEGIVGKKWSELKPMDKHDLYFANRALYDALKAEHERAASAA